MKFDIKYLIGEGPTAAFSISEQNEKINALAEGRFFQFGFFV